MIKRLLICAALMLCGSIAAHATTISIPSTTVPNWRRTTTAPVLRAYYDQTFTDSAGTIVQGGNPQQGTAYLSITTSILSNTVTIPAFTITSTRDGLDRTSARISFYWYSSTGQLLQPFEPYTSLAVPASIGSATGCSPSGTCCSLAELKNFQSGIPPYPPTLFYSTTEIDRLLGVFSALSLSLTDDVTSVTSYASLSAAVSTIGSAVKTLVIPNVQTITSSVTIPSNITFRVTGSGRLDISAGTVAINGPIDAPPGKKLFAISGSGAVTIGGPVAAVYPQWFGAVGDGSTDDSTPIQLAINSVRNVTDATVGQVSQAVIYFPQPSNYYKITTPLLITKNFLTMRGASNGVMIQNSTSGSDVIRVNFGVTSSLTGTHIESLMLKGNGTGSRAIYMNQTEHAVVRDINCIGHGGPALYMESTGLNLSGCAFTVVTNLLAQPSAAVSAIQDFGGISNTFIGCRIREAEIGFLLTKAFGDEILGCYIESNNRGTAKTGIKCISTDTVAIQSKRTLFLAGTYFENNPSYSIDADNTYSLQIVDCSVFGGVNTSTKVRTGVAKIDGGGTMMGVRGGTGGLYVQSAAGIVLVSNSTNIYGLISAVKVKGSMPPFDGGLVNSASRSWMETEPTWSATGTSAPTLSLDTTVGFYSANSKKVVFPAGGNGASYSRVFMSSANISSVANDVYTSMLIFKFDTAGEVLSLRHSGATDGTTMGVLTETDWMIAVLASSETGAGTANTNAHMSATPAAPVTMYVGAIGSSLLGDRLGLINTEGAAMNPSTVGLADISVGGGTVIRKVLKSTVTINPTSINGTTVATQTFTLTGAATGDILILNPPAAGLTAGLFVLQSFVSSANTISIVFYNSTGAPIDEASASWTYTLIKT